MVFAITAASGQLGELAAAALVKLVPAKDVILFARDPSKIDSVSKSLGTQVRKLDYSDSPETIKEVLKGVDRLLLISANVIGQRYTGHKRVIDAAVSAGVKFIAYTSVINSDKFDISLVGEHAQTEKALESSGVDYALLRNGWYNENFTESAKLNASSGVYATSNSNGKVSSAARKDYAEAAAKVLADPHLKDQIYNLAGDDSYTEAEYVKTLSKISGKPIKIVYQSQEEYTKQLEGFGLPSTLADALAEASEVASRGFLFDDSRALSKLIGHPTTSYKSQLEEVFSN